MSRWNLFSILLRRLLLQLQSQYQYFPSCRLYHPISHSVSQLHLKNQKFITCQRSIKLKKTSYSNRNILLSTDSLGQIVKRVILFFDDLFLFTSQFFNRRITTYYRLIILCPIIIQFISSTGFIKELRTRRRGSCILKSCIQLNFLC